MASGLIFDVRRYSIHDGPGIRTTVFFKGCPLHCLWCHNPESQIFAPELMLLPNRCIDCGACAAVCPYRAVTQVDGEWVTDREKCQVCGRCGQVCYADGRQIIGEEKSVEEVMAIIDLDRAFYAQSAGGVTFSGGEPLAQPEMLTELLRACKQRGYHTALDTCGFSTWKTFESMLPDIDLVLFDLKLMDSTQHERFTGVPNEHILDNLQKLALTNIPYWVRVPIIPGITDAVENLSTMADFLRKLPEPVKVCLLPYHSVAATKYHNLGHNYSLESARVPGEAEMDRLGAIFREAGFVVQCGG